MSSTAPLRRYAFQSPWAPVAGGPTPRVDLYRQGATVTAATTISNGGTTSVSVADVGAIASGDSVRVGVLGPVLSVSSVTPPSSLSLHNTTGSSVTVPLAVRLLDLTARPSVYADPNGATALSYPLIGDSTGEVSGYLADALYDAVLVGNAPTPDVFSDHVFNSTGSSTNWNHTVSGKDTLLVVAVSWQDSANSEAITGITYQTTVGGVTTTQNLTLAVSDAFVDIYTLTAPIAGTGTITVTWNGNNGKGAICGAICFSLVDQVAGVGATGAAANTSTLPTQSLTPKFAYSALLSAVAADETAGTVSAWNLTGALQWNDSSASSPALTQTRGAASIQPSGPSAISSSWILSGSRRWAVGAIEIIPSEIRLYADTGSTSVCCNSLWLNAQDFGSLAEAIDALGPRGGTVYLPNGDYTLSAGLVIDREQITLAGESQNAVIRPVAPNLFDLVTVNASHFRMRNVTLDGLATVQDQSAAGKSCLVLNGLGAAGRLVLASTFQNLILTGAPKYGLFAHDAILATFTDCECISNRFDGARLETLTTGVVGLRFLGCNFSQNDGRGMSADNCTSVLLDGCAGAGNSRDGTTGVGHLEGSTIHIEQLGVALSITGCDFEGSASAAENLVYLNNCYSCTVASTKFSGVGYGFTANRGFRTDTTSVGIELRACAFSHFQGTVDSPVPAHAVAALLGSSCVSSANFVDQPGGATQFVFVGTNSVDMLGGRVNSAYASKSALPSVSAVQPGTVVYLDSPPTSNAHLQVTDGSTWRAVGGGVIAMFVHDSDKPAAGSVDAGTLAYVSSPDTGNTKLQISDGTSNWINVA